MFQSPPASRLPISCNKIVMEQSLRAAPYWLGTTLDDGRKEEAKHGQTQLPSHAAVVIIGAQSLTRNLEITRLMVWG